MPSSAPSVASFLQKASLDWRVGGSQRAMWTLDTGSLLEHGADAALLNTKGESAAVIAERRGLYDVAALFR